MKVSESKLGEWWAQFNAHKIPVELDNGRWTMESGESNGRF